MNLNNFSNLWNKGIVYFKPSAANYWHSITSCFISEKPIKPGRYYLDFTSKAEYTHQFDSNGIPLFKNVNDVEANYHPIVISQYALGLYDKLHQSDFKDLNTKTKFLAQANWLLENRMQNGNLKCWYFNYKNQRYKAVPPWCSAMAQGEGISVLCRAYILTNDRKFLDAAEESVLPFEKSVEDGGVVNEFNNLMIYEECATTKLTGVLNGFIFSLFGLFDLALLNPNSIAQKCFDKGIENILMLLKWYDLGYWSRYDLFEYPLVNPASFTYHNIHVHQLKALYILTGSKEFNEYSMRWSMQSLKIQNRLKALFNKMIYLKKVKAV